MDKTTIGKPVSLLRNNKDILLFLVIMCFTQAVFLGWYKPKQIDERLDRVFPLKVKLEKIHASLYTKAVFYTARLFPAYRKIGELSTSGEEETVSYPNGVTYPPGSRFSYFFITLPCNGYKVYGQFLCVILFYFGPWKKKLWYIPLGIFVLMVINGIRLITLYFVGRELPGFYDFYHVEGSRYIMYPLIFILFMIWERKINRPYQKQKEEKKLLVNPV